MRYWYDTEFIEDGKTIDLISIGIVAEDGREYYAISTEFDETKASDWVKENVLTHLPPRSVNFSDQSIAPSIKDAAMCWRSRNEIAVEVVGFLQNGPALARTKHELWGYYSAYDHVALCQLFGAMMELPKGFPMYTRDIKQLCDSVGNPKLPEQGKGEHNALCDAQWNKVAYEFLISYSQRETGVPK